MAVGGAERRFACVGDNCVDVYLDGGSAERAGGNALNVAFELARGGQSVAYFGAVGDDSRGQLIVTSANAAAINVDHVEVVDGVTGYTLIDHDGQGERLFVEEDYGVAANYRMTPQCAELLASYLWVHLARQPDGAAVADTLRSKGALLSCDFGEHDGVASPPRLCSQLEVAFFSLPSGDATAARELGAAANRVGNSVAVVTMGAGGSIAVSDGAVWEQPALAIDVVDSLGAGDAFIAGFIRGSLDGNSVEARLAAAAAAGAEACTRVGLGIDPQQTEAQ